MQALNELKAKQLAARKAAENADAAGTSKSAASGEGKWYVVDPNPPKQSKAFSSNDGKAQHKEGGDDKNSKKAPTKPTTKCANNEPDDYKRVF